MAILCVACATALALGGCSSQARTERSRTTPARPPSSASRPTAFGFFDARRAVMTTLGGSLMISDDGGRSWHFERRLALLHMDVVSSRTAYGSTASSLWRTDDAGLRWRLVAGVSGALSFANPSDGWVTEARKHPPPRTKDEAEEELRPTYVVWSTDDGGRRFQRLSVPCQNGGGAFMFASLSRVTAAFGFDGCGGEPSAGQQLKSLYVTHDGGHRWTLLRSARLPRGGYMTALSFSSAERGLMLSDRGGLASSDDGGRHWQLLLLTDDINSVTAAQRVGAHGLAALLFTGSLLYSENEGCSWRTVYVSSASPAEGEPVVPRERPAICH